MSTKKKQKQKQKQPPFVLTVAQSARYRLTQTGPDEFVLERNLPDSTGAPSWRSLSTEFGISTEAAMELILAKPGLVDLRAPWPAPAGLLESAIYVISGGMLAVLLQQLL